MSCVSPARLLPVLALLALAFAGLAFTESKERQPTVLRHSPASEAARGRDYSIVDLGTLGGRNSRPISLNNRGQVVGMADTADRPNHSFRWEEGAMTDLLELTGRDFLVQDVNDRGQIVGQLVGISHHAFLLRDDELTDLGALRVDPFSVGIGINALEQVLGWSYDYQLDTRHSFLWEHGFMTDLGTLGGTRTEGAAINGMGQIVGWSYTAQGVRHAFLWQAGVMTDLGVLAGDGVSAATGINEHGQIIGYSAADLDVDTPAHAFLWQGGVMTPLGTLGGSTSYPFHINQRGQVIGSSSTSSNDFHSFFWQDGVMTDLGTLGGNFSLALDMNERGQVVGYSRLPEEGGRRFRGFVWENGTMKELETLGGPNSFAARVNEAGLVLGRAELPNRDVHACLWEKRGPGVPQPFGRPSAFDPR